MKKIKVLLLFFLFIVLWVLVQPSAVVAQDQNGPQVIKLSDSGYDQARSLAYSADGSRLAVGGISGISIFEPTRLSKINFIPTGDWARSVAFQPGTDLLASAVFDGTIKIWDTSNYELKNTLTGPNGWVRSISFSADGSVLASAADDGILRIWNMQDEKPVLEINQGTLGLRAVALSPDGKLVAGALGAGENVVRIWSVENGKLLYTLNGHTSWVRCLEFSPDGQLLASGSFDTDVILWNVKDGTLRSRLSGHTASVLGVTFSADGLRLASGSVDQTVRLWNVIDGSPLHLLKGHTGFVYDVAFSPDGNTLASGGADNTVRLWDMRSYTVTASSAEALVGPVTPSDCRYCHHRRGQNEAPQVLEISCQDCHASGAGLAWCQAFPRSALVKIPKVTVFASVGDRKGLPVNATDIAVVLASPGNGETQYVVKNTLAPLRVSGKVFASNQNSLSVTKVKLEVISEGQVTAVLETKPLESGIFQFQLGFNPTLPPPQLTKPGTRQCLVCHGDYEVQAGVPEGVVQFVVTAELPDGQKATDKRWMYLDQSHSSTVPVEVLDADTHQPLDGISVEASTILYAWRNRFGTTTTGKDGLGQLSLDALSLKPTRYDLLVPPQVVNGIKYASVETTELDLDAASSTHSKVTLLARAVTGQIQGNLASVDDTGSLAGINVWAVQMPFGTARLTTTGEQGQFNFDAIPVSQYIILPDGASLSDRGLFASAYPVDLFTAPLTNLSFSLEKGSVLTGKVTDSQGGFLPFAWLAAGNQAEYLALDPVSGGFYFTNFPKGVSYLSASAPGYYSLSKSVTNPLQQFNFQLVPRPETRFVTWGGGVVTIPAETQVSQTDNRFELSSGWFWGNNSHGAQSLSVKVNAAEIMIEPGQFAIEKPVTGTSWLYVYVGSAEVKYPQALAAVHLEAGQMIALVNGASVLPMNSTVALAYHPKLNKLSVANSIEPTLSARLQSFLVVTGIGAMQTITFLTYLVSLVILIVAPIMGILFYLKKSKEKVR